jgi:signal transduction histidine kinase
LTIAAAIIAVLATQFNTGDGVLMAIGSLAVVSATGICVFCKSCELSDKLRITNEELRHSQRKLETQLRQHRETLNRVGYEMRVPARVLNLISQETSSYSDARLQVHDASATLLRALDGLIPQDASGFETPPEDSADFSLSHLAEDLRAYCTVLAVPTGARIAVQGVWPSDVGQLRLTADYRGLRNCVVNLVQNALTKAQAEVVTIVLVAHEVTENGVELKLEVRDDGCGLSRQQMRRIMLPNYWGGKPKPGAIMGIAIVKEWLHRNRAALKVESAAEFGTRFFFQLQLPLVQSPKQ